MSETKPAQATGPVTWKQRLKALYVRFKSLQGDPHYIAMGMASGVFVAVTPTMPFHTAIAIAIAFVLKGSKPAAIIGVWFCNPLTFGPFYIGSYQVGMLLLGRQVCLDLHTTSFQELMAMGADVAIAMVVGGALLGIIPAVLAYLLTFYMFRKIRARRKRHRTEKVTSDHNVPDDGSPLASNRTEDKRQP